MIEVRELTHDYWEKFAQWFGYRGKSDCWCMWPRLTPGTYRPGDPSNRESLRRIVSSGVTPGLIAMLDAAPVGWCAVGLRDDYPQYGEASPDPHAWAIACLFIDERSRGRGVARALVEAAVSYASERRANVVYGPPPWWLPGD